MKWTIKLPKDTEEPLMHFDNLKKPVWKRNGYTLFESKYMAFWKWQNYKNSKKITGCQGSGGKREGINR